ncbi:hypothetical protein CDD82_5046 [Ophiocordyceps australis]|uniref:Glycosyltransferase 2-like domain-containing protein n=1 Tax=Ophiocordyceps australis TaxID=1399860 RepID=A0A2C5Z2J6_9HYPO|nr:hypothetical protein CDD82_5046 [Ophiocordyceps australis]
MLLTRLNGGFWLLWLSLFILCYFNSVDDPTSLFYDGSRAYEQRFSLERANQARDYLQHLPRKVEQGQTDAKFLCIGVPSINRTSESFLGYTIATLTDSISPKDRARIHLVVLLADKSPEKHFAYSQPWLAHMADEVLLYGDGPSGSNSSVYRTIDRNVYKEGSGRGTGRVENMRLDHSVLVERCRKHASPYFALIEDDIIAAPNWFAKLSEGLAYVETQSKKTGKDWLYLRLFYSELLMGWNNEEMLLYAQNILLVYTVVLLSFLVSMVVKSRLKRRRMAESIRCSALLLALILCLWLPALVALYIVAGRVSMRRINPFAWSWHPAREMPNFGCCAQGLVFAQRNLEGVEALLRQPPYAFAGDQILEDYARDHSLAKWALEPSVLQHVGLKQSSAGDARAEVWNFSFERQRGTRGSHGAW